MKLLPMKVTALPGFLKGGKTLTTPRGVSDTEAAEYQFRPTARPCRISPGGSNADGGYGEDGGFAINGGKGWASCVYDNHKITKCDDVAIAMGNYRFTCKTTRLPVEYTFGYKRCEDDEVRIFLHHSSVPYAA
ncbi:hypothetical protein JL720_16019 [Aureococcus anophagefferens]|nr:hypothetical protein JL720_16019 [Aureococcus anophagefferens]